ncbi:MAG: hypothetical protein WCT40_04930, partial [Candidatus Magasanikbacteria bacterium]
MKTRAKILLIFILGLFFCLGFFWYARAENSNQTINVNLTVPVMSTTTPNICGDGNKSDTEGCDDHNLTNGDGCSSSCVPEGGCVGECSPPNITSISSSTTDISAQVTWTASDDIGIDHCSFSYSPSSGSLTTSTFEAIISALTPSTLYTFTISCFDAAGKSDSESGQFQTKALPIYLEILTHSTTPGVGSIIFDWTTNLASGGSVSFGLNNQYSGGTATSPTVTTTHSATATNLLSCTDYFYQLHSWINQESDYFEGTVTTLREYTPPAVTNLRLATTSNEIILNWNNPSPVGDFIGVKILKNDTQIADNNINTYTDEIAVANCNVSYCYLIEPYDRCGNVSGGLEVCGKTGCGTPTTTPGFCGDGQVDIDLGEQCDLGDASHGNGNGVCPKTCGVTCQNNPTCQPPPENCGNNIDDDGNGLTDCADSACASDPDCQSIIESFACSDGNDNDGDGLIDFPADPGCISAKDTDEYNSDNITVDPLLRLSLDEVIFSAGNRLIRLQPVNDTITSLSGSHLTVGIRQQSFNSDPVSLRLIISGAKYLFNYSDADKIFYADISFPSVGSHQGYIEIDYGGGQFDSLAFSLNSLGSGVVTGAGNERVENAVIQLLNSNGQIFPANTYGQSNPVTTGINGFYGWVAPNGTYRMKLSAAKYFDHETQTFTVTNNVVNRELSLILIPDKLLEYIPASLRLASQAIKEILRTPQAQKTAAQAAPISVAVISVGAASILSWIDLLAWLQFIFFQPILIFGRRKRSGWSQVYNSLTKLPIDLATVRLVNAVTGKIVQSRVTDKNGRFTFIAAVGDYRIDVYKNNFVFPSAYLKDFKNDGKRTDVYHGETIKIVEKDTVINVSVPLDPLDATSYGLRLFWRKFGRRFQLLLSGTG